MLMRDYLASYLLSRDISHEYAQAMRRHVAALSAWLGYDAPIDLDAGTLNRWLIHVAAEKAPKTVRGYRQTVMSLLNAAEDDGLRGPLGRIRRPKVPRKPPIGWTLDQVRRLIAAAQSTPGYCPRTGLAKNLLLECTIRLCWDSGARIGDVLAFRWVDLHDGGRLGWSQRKTGHPRTAQLSPSTMDCLQRLHAGRQLERLAPWNCRNVCHRLIAAAVKAAGLRGATRMLRRGSASYVERERPGTAWQHLGHTAPGLDREAYIDAGIAYAESARPPEL